MDTELKINRAKTRLLLSHPFFATLAMRMPLIPTKAKGVQTAVTNGKDIKYNPAWFESLTENELMGVLAHETMHVALGHAWRRGERDSKGWNKACDYAINDILLNSGLELPEDRLYNPEFKDLAAEEIYRHEQSQSQSQGQSQNLPGQQGQGQQNQQGQSQGQPGQGQQTQQGQNQGQGQQQEQAQGQPQAGQGQGQAQGQGQSNNDPGGCGAVEDSPAEENQKALEAEWRVAVAQAALAAKGQGHLPGELQRLVDEIVNPSIPWYVLLRDFVERSARNDYDWTRPNRRYLASGFCLPSLISEELPEIVIAIDTSGSIGQDILDKFAAEASAVLGAYDTKIHILYVDSRLQGHVEISRADLPLNLKPIGGGGTRFSPAFEWVETNRISPACLIYLTDMQGQFPTQEPDYPVLWINSDGERPTKPPFGDVVKLN